LLNIHPSLLPKYPGLHTHRQVLENGDEEHGTSVQINGMFLGLYPRRNLFLAVASKDRHFGLQDNRTAISLLPKYPGLHTHRQVLENGDEEHGTSVHFVTDELADKGRAKDTHIARQHHQIRGVGVNFMHQLTIERFPDKRHPACGIQ
jgi:hypothetical protein